MTLLCVKVKRGRLHGPSDKFNTYVVLKVQNLRSTTVTRRGNEPCWEQDYMFEINDLRKGLVVEVWDKGLIWDTLLGTAWIPLKKIEHAMDEGFGTWWILNSEVLTKGDEICGAKNPTSHKILLDTYFELPAEIPEDEAQYLIERLRSINAQLETEQETNENDIHSKSSPGQVKLSLPVLGRSLSDSAREDFHCDYQSCSHNSPTKAGNGQLMHRSGLVDLYSKTKERLLPVRELRKHDGKDSFDSRSEGESFSSCSRLSSQQHSLESKPSLELTNGGSLESRQHLSTTPSHGNSLPSYSEGSESDAVHDSTVGSDCESRSTVYSYQQNSQGQPSDQENSTCCSQCNSNCSCASQDSLKVEEDPDGSCNHTPEREDNMKEEEVCMRSISRSRWKRVIEKHPMSVPPRVHI
ncbi:protein unc-13 homolog B-like [Chiloscyllium plagiosum]|uniref:protein unc-13 homolog B-like n=1 Tax=Chiloscyllium plagiosum TaxID=36176 RepID=UPI001CB7D056|nr:protein unc-13 homolog B-like [Chiloscyllium plagiosum]